jgi:hypothetical protein
MIPMPSVVEVDPRKGHAPLSPLETFIFAIGISFQQLTALPESLSGWWAIGTGSAATLLAILAARSMPRWGAGGWRTRLGHGLVVATIAFLPALGTLLIVSLLGGAPGPEAFLLAITAGAVLLLLTSHAAAGEYRFALAASSFLFVLSTIVVAHPAAALLQTVYAGAASCWLAIRRESWAAAETRGFTPLRATLLIPVLAVAIVVAAGSGAIRDAARAVAGFMPFSGGDSWNDPWANDGIGDGENLVAGQKDASSSGPVDSELFLTSDRPSLYDLFNDQYGDPPRTHERAVALDASEVRDTEGKTADSDHAGREFSTVRSGRRRTDKPADLAARTLLTVDGPTPILLRLEAFDRYDGRTWSTSADPRADRRPTIEILGGDWIRVGPAGAPLPADDPEHHAVTVGTLESPVLPLPTRTERMRIPRVADPAMFRLPAEELPALARSTVPAGTTVSVVSRPEGIDGRDPEPGLPFAPALRRHGETPDDGDVEQAWLDALLHAWGIGTAGNPDWRTVAAVVARVRRHAELDPSAVASPGSPDTVEHFLTVSRRGPDYQFAGATTLILRHLGFRTRLASGLDVSGARRDPRSRRVIAAAEDVHVWAEIQDASGRWIPLQATPGRRLRGSGMSLARWLALLLLRIVPTTPHSAVGLAGVVASALVVGALTRWRWRRWADGAVTALWRFEMGRASVCPLEATWRLVERRAWIAGNPRPAHETVRRWYLPACGPLDGGEHAPAGFIRAFEAVSYGGPDACRDRAGHRRIAFAAERSWTLEVLLGRVTATPAGKPSFSLPFLLRRTPT